MAAVRTVKDYAITVLLILMFTLFSAASFRTESQQRGQDVIAAKQVQAIAQIAANTQRVEATTAKLAAIVAVQCGDRNRAAKGTNTILQALESAVRVTRSLPAQEKIDRLVLYKSSEVPLVACPVTP